MPGKQYVGKAGHLAVMGELALRGYNVAMPEIDIGDDVFAVNDATGAMWRIQVKTATGSQRGQKFWYGCRVKRRALATAMTPQIFFIFALRVRSDWKYVIASRDVLWNDVRRGRIGSDTTQNGVEYVQFSFSYVENPMVVECSRQDVTHLVNDWTTWPVIED